MSLLEIPSFHNTLHSEFNLKVLVVSYTQYAIKYTNSHYFIITEKPIWYSIKTKTIFFISDQLKHIFSFKWTP